MLADPGQMPVICWRLPADPGLFLVSPPVFPGLSRCSLAYAGLENQPKG